MHEPAHFEFLRKTVLPSCLSRDRVRIWSAACSIGEERYAIAFSLMDALGSATRPRIRIVPTDISSRCAKPRGVTATRLENLPPAWRDPCSCPGHASAK